MKKRAVVALGGNALIKPDQTGTIYEQFANTRETMRSIVCMIQNGWDVVVTHGNGPQVGAILLQNQHARELTPPMPLGVCVAESEGLIGYMVQQCLSNALSRAGVDRAVVTLITQVVVDQEDPSFQNPTKPIGPSFSEEEARQMQQDGVLMAKQQAGWRMMVPSPDPKYIVEGEIIKNMLDDDIVVIASGGGGMPVVEREDWGLDGLEAVVDKDLASERLAETVQAEVLLILTNADRVYLYYGTDRQKPLDRMSLSRLKQLYAEGHFPPGSMGPKMLAAIRFLEAGGDRVIISDISHGWEALQGSCGTCITRE